VSATPAADIGFGVRSARRHLLHSFREERMQVQVLEFQYESTSIEEMESQINTYLDHHDVTDVQFSRWEDTMVAFFVTED
jgi:hypothetical protein